MGKHHPQVKSGIWDVIAPIINVASVVDSMGRVLVRVSNGVSANTGFHAVITDVGTTGPPISSADLVQESTAQFWSALMFAGTVHVSHPPPVQPNKTVKVEAFKGTVSGGTITLDFEAVDSGSGSSGSDGIKMKSQRCHFCHAHEPVPVALTLHLDSPVSPGTAADCGRLNHPTVLRHGGHPGTECSWLSHPIDFCSDSANPALWMLHKSDAKTWMLYLRRGKTDIVVYRHTTAAEKDCSFPIQLHLAGAGGYECKDWPRTVTGSPAP